MGDKISEHYGRKRKKKKEELECDVKKVCQTLDVSLRKDFSLLILSVASWISASFMAVPFLPAGLSSFSFTGVLLLPEVPVISLVMQFYFPLYEISCDKSPCPLFLGVM
jgi:hypothetical protein